MALIAGYVYVPTVQGETGAVMVEFRGFPVHGLVASVAPCGPVGSELAIMNVLVAVVTIGRQTREFLDRNPRCIRFKVALPAVLLAMCTGQFKFGG